MIMLLLAWSFHADQQRFGAAKNDCERGCIQDSGGARAHRGDTKGSRTVVLREAGDSEDRVVAVRSSAAKQHPFVEYESSHRVVFCRGWRL